MFFAFAPDKPPNPPTPEEKAAFRHECEFWLEVLKAYPTPPQ